MSLSLRTLPALALALVLSACGGGSVEPVTQKGFGPSQLYDPARNPTGRVLQEGDTGIVMLGGSGPQQVWFEIGEAATYGVELEDEDLATLARVEVANASGQTLAWADAAQRTASADLAPGRYVMRLAPAATAPAEGTALFLHFDADEAKAGAAKTAENERRLLQIRACVGCDLRGANLDGIILRNADLRYADLRGANLRRAYLGGAQFDAADLRGANLNAANLSRVFLVRADLQKADLSHADLSSGHLHDANLAGANLANADLSHANLITANLSSTNMFRADLRVAKLLGANLADADLRQADLNGADLDKANLAGANFQGAIWTTGSYCGPSPLGECWFGRPPL